MSYKNYDGLMRHLRAKGISIGGSKQKRQLMNTGYFHGYKGYRFFWIPAKNCHLYRMTRCTLQSNTTQD